VARKSVGIEILAAGCQELVDGLKTWGALKSEGDVNLTWPELG